MVGASRPPLPPGPPRYPLIGSMLSLPSSDEPNWLWFIRWGKKTRSDIIHFHVLGSHTIVLNSREAAVDLLEHRSSAYSDRPHMVMAGELVGWGQTTGMVNYASGARDMRKLIHSSMGPRAMQDWWPHQEQELLKFLQKLLHTPDDLIDHIRHAAGTSVVRLTYGYTPKEKNDGYIAIAERAMDSFSQAAAPGRFMVDILPALKYVPWAPFKRTAAEWRGYLSELVNTPMAFVNDQLSKGVAEASLVSKWLEESGPNDDKSLIPWTAASLYAGGTDTTFSAISSFFVAILHNQQVQKTAQAEIDRVLGRDRLPTLADRASLPYVEALYKEVFRWIPLGPIGVPHKYSANSDDEYRGMRIPANSMIIANLWNMLQDQAVYKDPTKFNPARYLGPGAESNPEDVVFGFGRRRCPGVAVAQSSIWLSIALTLAAYDVTPLIGEDGKPVLPSLEYQGDIVRHPYPFKCKITPRSEKMRRLIEDSSL